MQFWLAAFVFFSIQTQAGPLPRVVQGIPARMTSLDIFSLQGIEAYSVTGNVVEPLARLHPKTNELIPCLAVSWEVNREKLLARIKLRERVKFHNGMLLTAEDVKFTFDSYFDPRFKGELWRFMWEDVESAQVVGQHIIEFRFKKLRYQSFENLLTTLRIVPKKIFSASNATFRERQLIGTGPFKVATFLPNRSLYLIPNKNWWGAQQPEFGLLVRHVTDAKLARQMLVKGDLDYFEVSTSEAGDLMKDPRMVKIPAVRGEGLWILLNVRHRLFRDQRVREALTLMWDRVKTSNKMFFGDFKIASDTFSPQVAFYQPGKLIGFDLQKAKTLLRDAGWKDKDRDGILEKRIEGVTYPLKFTVILRSSQDERWLSLFQSDAARAGVGVSLRRIEDDERWWSLLREGKFEASASRGGLSVGVVPSVWHSRGAFNLSGYENSDVDRLLEQLESEFDPRKRFRLQRDLLVKVRSDHVEVPGLYSPNSHFLISSRLRLDTEFPLQAWRWSLAPKPVP